MLLLRTGFVYQPRHLLQQTLHFEDKALKTPAHLRRLSHLALPWGPGLSLESGRGKAWLWDPGHTQSVLL